MFLRESIAANSREGKFLFQLGQYTSLVHQAICAGSLGQIEWDDIDIMIRQFQGMTQLIKFSPKPVVVAPFGMALGGGCEVSLHGAVRQPHVELRRAPAPASRAHRTPHGSCGASPGRRRMGHIPAPSGLGGRNLTQHQCHKYRYGPSIAGRWRGRWCP